MTKNRWLWTCGSPALCCDNPSPPSADPNSGTAIELEIHRREYRHSSIEAKDQEEMALDLRPASNAPLSPFQDLSTQGFVEGSKPSASGKKRSLKSLRSSSSKDMQRRSSKGEELASAGSAKGKDGNSQGSIKATWSEAFLCRPPPPPSLPQPLCPLHSWPICVFQH